MIKSTFRLKPTLFALIWAIYYLASVCGLIYFELPPPLIYAVILSNIVLFIVSIYSTLKGLKLMDELQMRIHFEAVVIAFEFALLLIMTLGLFELTKNPVKLSYLYLFPLLYFFYFIGLAISRRKYR